MSITINYQQINKDLKKLAEDYRQSYDEIAKSSRNYVLANLKPGEQVPKEGIIYGDEYKEQFKTKANSIKSKALEIIDKAKTEMELKVSEPPSAEMTNLITVLNFRNDLTSEEVDNMLEQYSDNIQTFRAIKSIAKDKGIQTNVYSQADEILQSVSDLRRVTSREFDAFNTIKNNGFGAVGIFAYGIQVDSAFPVKNTAE